MVTLLRGGVETASRSVKYHRPRGAFCMAGICGQCWMRIDDLPNRAACTTRVRPDLRATRENAFPSADFDVFRAADVFFASLDHHRLGTTPLRPLNAIMQDTARRMAGLGTLSTRTDEPGPAIAKKEIEVAVIGGGPAGLAAALACAKEGLSVMIIEARPVLGGQLRTRLYEDDRELSGLVSKAQDTVNTLALSAQAVAIYAEGLLLKLEDRVQLVSAKSLIIATGGYEQSPLFEQNDLPGHYGARALAELYFQHGILPGKRVVIADGGSQLAARLENRLRENSIDTHRVTEKIVAARGGTHVKGVELESGRRIGCDTIASAMNVAPAFELARQAGCLIEHRPELGGFCVAADAEGHTSRPGIYAAGEVTGAGEPGDAMQSGERAGRTAAREFRRS